MERMTDTVGCMAIVRRVAPIFPVSDLGASLTFYEGALIDLDGNVIRFGSPMKPSTS
jgi:hypothetical protein